MSKLKIYDLSFCETELPSNSQVQGGLSSSSIKLSPLLSFNDQSPTFSVDSGNFHTDYWVDNSGSKYRVTDSNGTVVGAGAAFTSTLDNGTKSSTSISASIVNLTGLSVSV